MALSTFLSLSLSTKGKRFIRLGLVDDCVDKKSRVHHPAIRFFLNLPPDAEITDLCPVWLTNKKRRKFSKFDM